MSISDLIPSFSGHLPSNTPPPPQQIQLQNQPPPPPSLLRAKLNIVANNEVHELSTIQEVDTPVSVKKYILLSSSKSTEILI